MTADGAAESEVAYRSKFADGTAKVCEIQRYSRQKTARQRIKNSKHCILRRTRTKIHLLVGDTPSPEKRPHSGHRKSADAEIEIKETLL